MKSLVAPPEELNVKSSILMGLLLRSEVTPEKQPKFGSFLAAGWLFQRSSMGKVQFQWGSSWGAEQLLGSSEIGLSLGAGGKTELMCGVDFLK